MLEGSVGSYTITGLIGKGGMGQVYLARHTLLGRPAAVKVLLPMFSKDEATVTRFFNEARAATAIRHAGIVEIYDFGYHTDGSAYIAMELLEGESLATRLQRGPLPVPVALAFTRQIAGALAAAHAKGIVHRDLKPDNIYLVRDAEVPSGERIKLLDFGIAKLSNDHDPAHLTRTGAVLGTPCYMSPEQCRGVAVDARADLYSLGCILFEMIGGRVPFVGEGVGDVLAAHIYVPTPALETLAPQAPASTRALVRRLLEKDPAARLQRAEDVIAAIDGAADIPAVFRSGSHLSTPSGPAVPATTTLSSAAAVGTVAPRARGGRGLLVIGGAAVAAAVAVAIVVVARGGGDSSSSASRQAATGEPDVAPPSPTSAVAVVDAAVAVVDAAVASSAAAGAPPPPADPAAPSPAAVSVPLALTTRPSGARVIVDGQVVGKTPYAGTLTRGDRPVRITLRAPGHADATLTVVPTAAIERDVKLTRAKADGEPPPGSRNPF